MKKMAVCAMAMGLTSVSFAGLYGDTPDAKHAWSVHDMRRPNPVKVTPANEVGQAPSDAVVLFDGTLESFEKNWVDANGSKTKWKFVNGTLESVRSAGCICSRQKFGDVQLHVEWQAPVKVEGMGQGRGNSGVFVLGGHYEIQVLDSYETDPANMKNPNYADGQAGSVYGQNPPMVNPTRKPGEWQSYDIVFHQPIFNGDELVHPGSLTVFLNGVLVQDHWELEGHTWHSKRPMQEKPKAQVGSIMFQDHGNPVHFRNVWVRPIPSRYANTTHGTFLAKEEDVMAKRREIAANIYAEIKDKEAVTCANAAALAEVVAYAKEGEYDRQWRKVATALAEELGKKSDDQLKAMKGEIITAKRASDVMARNKIVTDKCVLRQRLVEICNKFQWK